MPTLQEIMLRAQALRQETAVDSISPERAGSIMYDTLAYINQMQLQGANPLLISKIYASVEAMEADSAPVSDLTGQPLRPGQVVVIATGDPDDPDEGVVYRYDGTTEGASSWTAVGKIGNLVPVDSLDSDSAQLPLAAHQGKVLDGKITELGQNKVDNNPGVNLIDRDWFIQNALISDGTIIANASYKYTPNYIKVSPSTQYTYTGAQTPNGAAGAMSVGGDGICFYDADKNFISGISNTSSFTTPATCEYIRVGAAVAQYNLYPYIMLAAGASRPSWEAYSPILGYITTDSVPTHGSKNPIQSGTIYADNGKTTICDLMQDTLSVFGPASFEISSNVLTIHQTAAGNQAVMTNSSPSIASPYKLRIRAKCSTGTQNLMVGVFSGSSSTGRAYIELTTTTKDYIVPLTPISSNTQIALGLLAADVNIGNDITIYSFQYIPYDENVDAEVSRIDNRLSAVEQIVGTGVPPISFNVEGFGQSLSREKKYLTKIAFEGDSLIANPIGGAIPAGEDEGEGKRPIRMGTNNVPRRMYDFLSWNKPTWRRLDDSAWTNSGFSEIPSGDIDFFEGSKDKYWHAASSGAYIEIVVPSGMEHFALVARTKSGSGKLNVTINSSAPSSITYENPVLSGNTQYSKSQLLNYLQNNTIVNTSVCPIALPCGADQIDLNVGTSATGNPYALFEFNNLPSGQSNTIRFTTEDSTPVDVWGGFYWSGNTMVIMNIAHGGHTTADLISQHLSDELYNVDYDAVVFEVPEMNNTRLSVAATEADLESIATSLSGRDVCYTSCNLLGMSIPGDTNYWSYPGMVSGQLELNDAAKALYNKKSLPFIDLFQYFRWMTETRGGTLAGGEAGLYFTNDGQHGNILGVTLWANCLKQAFSGKAIMDS